jgi:basic membrane lipoprotein Med (substrate-binding protein (PBP1-ABC) superfamily)
MKLKKNYLFLVFLAILLIFVFQITAGVSAQPVLIVGAIYVGSVNDAGYNQAQKEGLEEMKKNIPGITLLEAENVPEGAEAERVIENMIQQGATLIFPTSFGHMEPAMNVAKRHPDVTFMHAGGWMQADNFGNYYGNMPPSFYPMGVAAGMMTKTNKLGFVIGLPIGWSIANVNSFHLGARTVNPDVQTTVVVTGGWLDRAKETAAANALIDQGCDVLTMHVDSPGTIIQTAEERSVYSIGFQSLAAQKFAPKGWITGIGFTWGGVMTEAAQQVIDGTWKSQMLRKGIAEGYIAVAPFGEAVPEDVRKIVLGAVENLADGFDIFAGPIKDQEGNLRISEGETVSVQDMGNFDWYAEGIIGKPGF